MIKKLLVFLLAIIAITYTRAMEQTHSSSTENCTICLDEINETLPSYHPLSLVNCQKIFGCSHVFHAQCLANWIEDGVSEKGFDKVTCPVCRNQLIQPTMDPINPHLEVAMYAPKERVIESQLYMNELTHFATALAGSHPVPEMKKKLFHMTEEICKMIPAGVFSNQTLLETALHQEHINLDVLEWILTYCASRGIHPRAHIDSKDVHIQRALARAFRQNYTSKISTWLLSHGAGVEKGGTLSLKHCLKHHNLNEALVLIDHGTQPTANTWFLQEVLRRSAQQADNKKYLVLAEQLVAAGTNIYCLLQEELKQYPNPFLYSSFFINWLMGHGTALRIEQTTHNFALFLIWAIHTQPTFAEWLVAHGTDINLVLTYMLQQVSIESLGHPIPLEQPVVQWLMHHGARPTVSSDWLVREALFSNPIDMTILQQQLALGKNPHLQDGVLLRDTIASARFDAAQWLCDHGAQPAVQRLLTEFSRTGPIEAVRFLAEHGADINTYCQEMIRSAAATPQIADYLCILGNHQTWSTQH
jgi:hypothetical protein